MKKLTTEEFTVKAIAKHGNLYDYSLCKYVDAFTKISIVCKEGHIFEQRPNDHLNGSGCNICSKEKTKYNRLLSLNTIKNKLRNLYDDKYTYDFTNYKNTTSKIKYYCEHGEHEATINSLLQKKCGCWKCNKTQPHIGDMNHFIEISKIIHGDYYDYSKSEYIINSIKTLIICPIHGEFKQTPKAHMRGNGCPICNMSKGEKKIKKYLVDNNINHMHQYKFDSLKKHTFDFYLIDLNICIEYDGEFHFNSYNGIGGDVTLNKTKKRDRIKNKFCLDNNIKLIRIPYWDFNNIYEILGCIPSV